jgi:hypothetical protein
MLGERVYGVSLFPLDKQNVTIGGLLNLCWTNRSIRDPFSRYALTFFEHMYTYETIHGHVGYSCLLLDTLNLPGGPPLPSGDSGRCDLVLYPVLQGHPGPQLAPYI